MTIAADPFVHEALLYDDPEQFIDGTVPFVLEGIGRDEPVLVVVPESHVPLLSAGLGDLSEQVTFLDMSEVGRNPGRIIPGVLLAFAARSSKPVRIIGEPIFDGRTEIEYPACVQHEAMVNAAFAGRTSSILCPYDTSALAPAMIDDAERTHPFVVQGAQRRLSESYEDPAVVTAAFNLPLSPPPPNAESRNFDTRGLAAMRGLVAEYATAANLTMAQVEDLVIAVNELTTNSVMHASGHGVLRIWREGSAVVCEVHDRGQISNPMAGRVPPIHDGRGGYGLMMANMLCDLVRIHSGENGTTVRVYISP
jgi:anti-sigma regulatory factor (Ser/Thr protein kinase)